MPFTEINLVPSVNIETTSADNPSGIQESQFVRWKGNLVEKRGGCTLFIPTKMEGLPVEIQPWSALSGDNLVATGTTEKVYYFDDSNDPAKRKNTDISPRYKDSPKVALEFSVKKNENFILIKDPNVKNITIYDSIMFNTPVSIGGIFLLGTYAVYESYGTNSFIIKSNYAATETVRNGGVVPKFTTTSGSTEVIVEFPIGYQAAQLKAGDTVGFGIPTDVGGLRIEGQYKVARIIDVPTLDKFVIVDDQAATSSEIKYLNGDANTGYADLRYWVTAGPELSGDGYGMNPYGGNNPVPPGPYIGPPIGYGQGQPIPPFTDWKTYKAKNWYLDNRGSTLIAAAVEGPIFFWDQSSGYENLAILPGAPVKSNGAFQAMPQGNIMAWGCSDAINPEQNPLYIRWCDSNNPTIWAPTLENTAGYYTIPTGSKIIRGIQGQTQQYWFTDIDVYSAQYIGGRDIYGFNKIGNGCGLIAPKAVTLLNSNVYWMSQKQFFICPSGGAPQPIPCSVWDFIFQNINEASLDKVVAGSNSLFNEVTWYFPAITNPGNVSGSQTAYVCFNAQYNEWDVGYLNRTAWFDQSIVGPPLGTDVDGWMYQHETSNDLAVGTETVAIDSWFKTGYFSLTNGQDLSFVDWLLPDFKWGQYSQAQDADIKFTFFVVDYAGQTPREYGPYTVNKDTPFICPRFRGRFMAMKIQSTDLGSFWRLGSIRYRFAPSGRR